MVKPSTKWKEPGSLNRILGEKTVCQSENLFWTSSEQEVSFLWIKPLKFVDFFARAACTLLVKAVYFIFHTFFPKPHSRPIHHFARDFPSSMPSFFLLFPHTFHQTPGPEADLRAMPLQSLQKTLLFTTLCMRHH